MNPDIETPLSVPEYFDLDDSSEIKYEYIDGEIYAMGGGTGNHSEIIHRLNGLMFIELEDGPFTRYNSDIRVQVSKTQYVYPDFTVVCEDPTFDIKYPNNLTNPTLIVEVLSESSEERDRLTKFDLYRRIESLNLYLIVAQDRLSAILNIRQDNGWLIQFYVGLDAVVPLDAINAQLKLSALYKTIQFPEDENLEND